jgi:hypothetical protein
LSLLAGLLLLGGCGNTDQSRRSTSETYAVQPSEEIQRIYRQLRGGVMPERYRVRLDSLTLAILDRVAENPMQDEFETTGEFQRRVQRFRSRPLIGGRSLEDLFLVSLKVRGPGSSEEVRYDADLGAFRLRPVRLESPSIDADYEEGMLPSRTVLVNRDSVLVSRFVGETIFGELVEVEDIGWFTSGVLVRNCGQFSVCGSGEGPTLTVKLPRDEARISKPNLRIAALVRPAEPYVFLSAFGADATAMNPRQFTGVSMGLIVDLYGLAAFNVRTGRVYDVRTLPGS